MNKNIKYILTDAIEGGGIAYWAIVDKVIREDKTPGHVTQFHVGDGDPDGNGKIKKGYKLINEKSILKARDKIVNSLVEVRRDIAAQFVGKPESWDYDSEGVDILIQISFFGKIVYG